MTHVDFIYSSTLMLIKTVYRYNLVVYVQIIGSVYVEKHCNEVSLMFVGLDFYVST